MDNDDKICKSNYHEEGNILFYFFGCCCCFGWPKYKFIFASCTNRHHHQHYLTSKTVFVRKPEKHHYQDYK